MRPFALISSLALSLSFGLPLVAAETAPDPDTAIESDADGVANEERVFLGMVPDTSASTFDGPSGVIIKRIEDFTTASDMGLQAGDVIISFNDHQIQDVADLKAVLEAQKIGNEATIGYLRDGQPQEASGELRGKLRPQDVDKIKQQLRQARDLAQKAGTDTGNFARSLRYLAIALDELPERVDEAAKQFKRIYPNGTFRVHIDIEIDSHQGTDDALKLEYGEKQDTPEDGEADSPETP
ncbi:MAG: PDZ domain-containing protein [Planctomycetota bacterium]